MSDSLSNKELVAVGHHLAKALSSDTPIMDIAKIVSRLAERLDCTTAALREMTKQCDAEHAEVLVWEKTMFKVCGEDGPKSVADKFAALEANCAALAAKGMELAAEAAAIYSNYNETQMPDRDLVDMQTIQEMHDLCSGVKNSDAFLAEVRAQGVEMVAESDQFSMWVQQGCAVLRSVFDRETPNENQQTGAA
ncbi:hypothetical protein QOY93_12575 [Leclercia adecarboxylata]|uniref:hypothetical protein n=1 Tax=Leclercia adecarboxylata TaxID=83655 RepID=UPI00254CB629|nr:hypothetical protein [Leclercia adecarboxylata]MDK4746187.1 hypothetical protein [Leclercia adecarboxylata]